MFYKLALRNIKKNMKDYLVYFISLTLSVSFFYMFSSLPYSHVISFLPQSLQNNIANILPIISLLVFISMILLITYTNKFIIKRRYQEFGVYISIGIESLSISFMLLIESVVLGIIALILGLFLGGVFSQGLQFLVASFFNIDPALIKFTISLGNIVTTILLFFSVFLIVGVISSIKIYFINPLKLIDPPKDKELSTGFKQKLSIMIFFITIISLLYNYNFLINTPFSEDHIINSTLKIPIFILLTYSFYYSLPDTIFYIIVKLKKMYYNNINIFSVKSFLTKGKVNWFLISTISLMILFSIVSFSIGSINNAIIKADFNTPTPNDLEFSRFNEFEIAPVEDFLNANGYENNEVLSIPLYDIDIAINNFYTRSYNDNNYYPSFSLNSLKLSDYNKLLALNNISPISLGENEFALSLDHYSLSTDVDQILNYESTIDFNNNTLHFNQNDFYNYVLSNNYLLGFGGYIILPDSALSNLPVYRNAVIIRLNEEYNRAFINSLSNFIKTLPGNQDINLQGKIFEMDEEQLNSMLALLLTLYLGSTFLLICMTLIFLQLLIETTENRSIYKTLKDIGVEGTHINQSILWQNILYFLFPLLLCIIHFIPGIIFILNTFREMSNVTIGASVLLKTLIIIPFYSAFIVLSYNLCKKIIN